MKCAAQSLHFKAWRPVWIWWSRLRSPLRLWREQAGETRAQVGRPRSGGVLLRCRALCNHLAHFLDLPVSPSLSGATSLSALCPLQWWMVLADGSAGLLPLALGALPGWRKKSCRFASLLQSPSSFSQP